MDQLLTTFILVSRKVADSPGLEEVFALHMVEESGLADGIRTLIKIMETYVQSSSAPLREKPGKPPSKIDFREYTDCLCRRD